MATKVNLTEQQMAAFKKLLADAGIDSAAGKTVSVTVGDATVQVDVPSS